MLFRNTFLLCGSCLIFSITTLYAETQKLSSPRQLTELIIGHRYDKLHSVLQKDATSIASQIDSTQEKTPITGDTRLRLLLLSVLDRLPLEDISNPSWSANHKTFLNWLFSHPDELALIATELRPEDRGESVLTVWSGLWQAEPNKEFRSKYAGLSLALALLYDSPGSVRKVTNSVYHPTLSLQEKYEYFRDASESGQLRTPCDRMSVRDLVRVVDAVISKKEIDWVHKHISSSPKRTGENYDAIEYLMERAVDSDHSPYSGYILSEIKKHGGICGDQSHYSSESAKVRGVPAMTVVGTGDRGAHAWITFMPDDNVWDKHASQGITNGDIYCMQRGKYLSARLLELESLDDYEFSKREPVLLHLTLAKAAISQKSYDLAEQLVSKAKKIGRHNWDIWLTEENLLANKKATPDDWKKFFRQIEKTFSDYSNVLEWSLKLKIKHLYSILPDEERTKLLDREIRHVARELGSQEDALITVIDRVASMLVHRKEADSLAALFNKSFRRYGEDLELFSKLMNSYTRHGAKIPEVQKRLPDDLHRAYKRTAESNSKEFFRAQMELRILKGVAHSYETLGNNPEKAKKLRKDIAKRQKKIERSAL